MSNDNKKKAAKISSDLLPVTLSGKNTGGLGYFCLLYTSMKYVKIIRDLREDNDLTQSQVAEYLGTSQTMYARYEREASELPVRHLLKLCELYGVSADYILGRVNK